MDEARECSVWLQPDDAARGQFAALIHALAAEFDAPVFEPHITLFAGAGRSPPLRTIAADLSSLELTTDGTAHTPQLFKTVFARIVSSQALRALAARSAASGPNSYVFEPHLSLIYKVLPERTRAQVADKIALPAAFSCDAVCLVVPSGAGWEDVGGWQIVEKLRLGA
jgi:2'-5' RNA ligase